MGTPSALEYARHHRLVQPPPSPTSHLSLLQPFVIDHDLQLTVTDFQKKHRARLEKLELNREGMLYLSNVIRPPYAQQWHEILDRSQAQRSLKCEVPLLNRDHGKDLKWFRNGLNVKRILKSLKDDEPPLWSVHDRPDEDSQLGSEALQTAIQTPQFEVSKADMHQILSLIKEARHGKRPDQWWDMPKASQVSVDVHKQSIIANDNLQITRKEPATPPLSPTLPPSLIIDPPMEHARPSQTLSSQSVNLDELLRQIELETCKAAQKELGEPLIRDASPVRTDSDRHSNSVAALDDTGGQHWAHSMETGSSKVRRDPALPVQRSAANDLPADDQLDEFFSDFVDLDGVVCGQNSSDNLPETAPDRQSAISTLRKCPSRPEIGLEMDSMRLKTPIINRPECGSSNTKPSELFDIDAITPYAIRMGKDSGHLNLLSRCQALKEQLKVMVKPEDLLVIPHNVTRSQDLLWKPPGLRMLDQDDNEEELNLEENVFIKSSSPLTRLAGQKHRLEEDDDIAHPDASQLPISLHVSPYDLMGQDSVPRSNPFTQFPIKDDSDTIAPPISRKPWTATPARVVKEEPETTVTFPKVENNVIALGKGAHLLDRKLHPAMPQPKSIEKKAGFSASGALKSFLDLRAGRFKRPDLPTPSAPSLGAPTDPIQSSQIFPGHIEIKQEHSHPGRQTPDPIVVSQAPTQQSNEYVEIPATQPEHSGPVAIPLPEYEPLRERRVAILNEDLIRYKSLMAIIDQQDEAMLRSIYRKLDSGPDIILNPTTCLICTNIQALKQKSLPGSKTATNPANLTMQDRLRSLSTQFERIFILLAMPNSIYSTPGQMQILTDFTSFCFALSLESPNGPDIKAIWITIGTSSKSSSSVIQKSASGASVKLNPMTAWTWHLIHKHSQAVLPTMSFIDDTTVWEFFLRDAGINALAAQMMLGLLKRGSDESAVTLQDKIPMSKQSPTSKYGSTAQNQSWGLRKLVSMSEGEKTDLFAHLVGEKCLSRLTVALNTRST